MRLAVVGVGTAGCRVADRILAVEAETGRTLTDGNVLAIDTEPAALEAAEHVPPARRLFVGDVYRGVEGEGTDGDPELAAAVAREERSEIHRAFDPVELFELDGVLVVSGLGGGTGGGAGAVVLEELRAIGEVPVYGVGILPAEAEGGATALTAARSLQSAVAAADNLVVFDNEAWGPDEAPTEADYDRMNRALATRVVSLFAAGEHGSAADAERRMDPSDVIRTLATGGVSSIGHASIDVPGPAAGLRAWLRAHLGLGPADGDAPATDAARIKRLVAEAVDARLTLPCAVDSAERALVVLSGPPAELSRKGFESGRYWLEREADTVEVLAGDEPHAGSSTVTAAVLLSNVTAVPRIDAMQAQAAGARPGAAMSFGDG